jgi:DNA-binding CsgD family transcriptional regulator
MYLERYWHVEYRGDASFMAWMYKIVGNVLISHARKHKSTQHVPLPPELNLPDVRSADPARTICDRLALHEAISQLTPEQQQVVVLKFFVGLSNLEIATILGRSEGAIKALQCRAIQPSMQIVALRCALQMLCNAGVVLRKMWASMPPIPMPPNVHFCMPVRFITCDCLLCLFDRSVRATICAAWR